MDRKELFGFKYTPEQLEQLEIVKERPRILDVNNVFSAMLERPYLVRSHRFLTPLGGDFESMLILWDSIIGDD